MATPENWLLCNRLRALVERLDGGLSDDEAAAAWSGADADVSAAGADEDAEIALPVWEHDTAAVRALITQWDAGQGHLPEWDRAVLKRALKAYRKRLKIARLDDSSSATRNPLTKGEESSITGVRPPDQYDQEIWDMLIQQGKLLDGGNGLLELATS